MTTRKELVEAVKKIKASADGITSTKKAARELKSALNDIVDFGKSYSYYEDKYDDLFKEYSNHYVALQALENILHMKIVMEETENDKKYYLIIESKETEEMKISITERQYLSLKCCEFVEDPEKYRRKEEA